MKPQNDELRVWTEAWRALEHDSRIDVAALRAEVKRRNLTFRAWLIAETAFLFAVFTGLTLFAWRSRDVADVALAGVFCILIVIGMIRNFSIARLHWRPLSQSTNAFIDVMLRRAVVTGQQIRLGWVVLTIEIAVFIPWIQHTLKKRYGAEIPLDASIRAWSHLAVLVAIAAFVLLMMRRRNRVDRQRWERLRGPTDED